MAKESRIARIRNIGIAAHIDAGKTTVTERVLYYAGMIHRMGTVDDGNTVTDFLDEERERGITIQSAAVSVNWKGCQLNIIDTPGHVDFTAEVERCLRVLDGAVIVFCGYGGVEAQSETVWRQADRYRVPRIAFVNKLDRMGADFDRVVDEMEKRLSATPMPLEFPNGTGDELKGIVDLVTMQEYRFDPEGKAAEYEKLALEGDLLTEAEARRETMLEQVACLAGEEDESLAEAYLEGREIDPGALRAAIRRITVAGKAQPVMCGAALRNVGVQPLMDAIADYLPSPRDVRETRGFLPGTDEEIARKNYPEQPFSGLIFKTTSDEHGEVSLLRIYSGRIAEGGRVMNSRRDRKEKVGRLFQLFADERRPVKEVSAGDIVAVIGLKFSTTGDTLCDPGHPILYERPSFPDPVVSMAIEPSTNADREKLEALLARLTRDDPTLKTWFDEETGQQIMAGMGELHLEVRRHQIESSGLRVKVGEPRVSYREGLRGSAEASVTIDTPLGGKPRFAGLRLRVEHFLNDAPSHVVFENEAPAEEVPGVYLEAVEEAVRDAATGGRLRRDPVINVRATLLGGAHRDGESTPGAFALAATEAFARACREAGPKLLEPIMAFEVVCPEEFLGGVLKDLRMRGAEVHDVAVRDRLQAITGRVPLSRMFEYASQLRSLTQGRGTASLEPCEYGEVSRQDYLRLVGE